MEEFFSKTTKYNSMRVFLFYLFCGTTGCCTYNFIIYDNRCKSTYVHAIEPSINYYIITLVASTNTVFFYFFYVCLIFRTMTKFYQMI